MMRVQAELVPLTGPTGEPTTLHESVFSTIPGSPAYEGRAQYYRSKVPALGHDLDVQNHNIIGSSFPTRRSGRFPGWYYGSARPGRAPAPAPSSGNTGPCPHRLGNREWSKKHSRAAWLAPPSVQSRALTLPEPSSSGRGFRQS